jgi:RHH-type proline utilization regulon transcriptional repressor/proline dehydrogenase/delta 1-pyrroline-5-carboxylate dehydrogenase
MADDADDLKKTVRAVKSYLWNAEQEFYQTKDYFRIRGEDNHMRYLPVGTVLVRVHPGDSLFEVLSRIAAVQIAKCTLILGIPKDLNNNITAFLSGKEGKRILGNTKLTRHTDQELIENMPQLDRIRYAAPDRVPAEVFRAAARTGFYIARNPVLSEGRLEMLHYFREQSVSDSYHRYGNLGERGLLK